MTTKTIFKTFAGKAILTAIMFTFLGAGSLFAASPVGTWKTIDDKTNTVKSHVKIWVDSQGKLNGRIIKLFRKANEEKDPKCTKCKGWRKGKRIQGLKIMWGLEKDSATEWEDGRILDPANGKEYSCDVEVVAGGSKLNVRGYIGLSVVGRTQTWIRVK